MNDMLKTFKKRFLTNKFAEFFLLKLEGINHNFYKKMLPSNADYKKGAFRSVKRNGIIFYLDISDYQQYLIYFNLNENSSKPVLNFIPNKSGAILDIGANIGQTSLWIAQKFEHFNSVNIHAFEPFPETFKTLEKNIKANHYKNIKLHNVALGSSNAEIMMVQDCETNSGGFRVFSDNHDVNRTKKNVRQITLDQFKDEIKDVFFMKIDVEGYEMEVLKGAECFLKTYKPILFIELNDFNLKQQNSSAREFIDFLCKFGYKTILDAETSKNLLTFDTDLTNCSLDIICN